MNVDILEYCVARKPAKGEGPTWSQVADEIFVEFGFSVGSISGLRSRVAEYRANRDPERPVRQISDVELPSFTVPRNIHWGESPRLVDPATTEDWETVVFVSDIHAPYHDTDLIGAACQLISDIDPHRVVINGDTNDFFQLSRFNKAQERLDDLQWELDMGVAIRRAFREAAPDAVMDETLGNHDERLITYVEINARSLTSLWALRPAALLGLEELQINHHPRHGFRLREEFIVEHGHVARKDSGASAKARLNDSLISGIMGHVHRLSSYRRNGYRKLAWFESGCLCSTSPDYIVGDPNWQPGLAVGMFSTRSSTFNVELVPALNKGFVFGGRAYGDIEDPETVPELELAS